ncbi:hypothetical protein [Nevskia sp.]|uniref:hypothetical protein n=1 Tax=Nevskia sp. TaxID=1929292 RepID=UPI0025E9A509|nr:hypothetical protein [Nevskia sp.]
MRMTAPKRCDVLGLAAGLQGLRPGEGNFIALHATAKAISRGGREDAEKSREKMKRACSRKWLSGFTLFSA